VERSLNYTCKKARIPIPRSKPMVKQYYNSPLIIQVVVTQNQNQTERGKTEMEKRNLKIIWMLVKVEQGKTETTIHKSNRNWGIQKRQKRRNHRVEVAVCGDECDQPLKVVGLVSA